MSAFTDWAAAIDRELRMTPGCDSCAFGGRACDQCLEETNQPSEEDHDVDQNGNDAAAA